MNKQNYPLYEVESVKNIKELVNYISETYGDRSAFLFDRHKEAVNISYRQFKHDVDAVGTAFFTWVFKTKR